METKVCKFSNEQSGEHFEDDKNALSDIGKISKLYKVLGEKNRLGIVYSLEKRDMCVHELTSFLGASQSLISHQLKILREADIVKTSRRRNEIIYSLADDHIVKLLAIAKEHVNE